MTLREPFSVPWGVLEDTLATRWLLRDHWKSFRTKIEISMIFRVPPGVHAFAADLAPPAAKNGHFCQK